jgi:integrase
MSIEKRARKKGNVYVVYWRDSGRNRNRTFDRRADAQAFDAQVKLAKRRGDLDVLDAGRETLAEFEQEWWENYALRHLAESTRKGYRFLIDKYILPTLGQYQLRKINPRLIASSDFGQGAGPQRKEKSWRFFRASLSGPSNGSGSR